MAYTAPTFKAGGLKALPHDSNGQAVQTAGWIQTQDATGTPVTSPATVATTQTLVVPLRAISCVITPVTNPVQVSEDSTQTAYYAIPAGASLEVPCARLTNLYLKTGSSTVVSFMFKMV